MSQIEEAAKDGRQNSLPDRKIKGIIYRVTQIIGVIIVYTVSGTLIDTNSPLSESQSIAVTSPFLAFIKMLSRQFLSNLSRAAWMLLRTSSGDGFGSCEDSMISSTVFPCKKYRNIHSDIVNASLA